MNQEQIDFIELYLKDNLQLNSVEYFENEDGNHIFVTEDCILTISDQYVMLDLDVGLYPDISAYLTLGVNDLTKELGKDIRIGEVFSFDENYEVHFGEEAIKYTQKYIDEQVEDIVEMDHLLMFNEGVYC